MSQDSKIVLGIDEVGRGPLAGPVIAAAVILLEGHDKLLITDSKKLSEQKIISTADAIRQCSIHGIGVASVDEIKAFNILQASMLAMRRAASQIHHYYDIVKIDGHYNPFENFRIPQFHGEYITVVGGDNSCRSIAAASIVAKAHRDALMRDLHIMHPQYGWKKNKGYGTKEHIASIKTHGLSEIHRYDFCRKLLSVKKD